jgi:hypothetical protein
MQWLPAQGRDDRENMAGMTEKQGQDAKQDEAGMMKFTIKLELQQTSQGQINKPTKSHL